LSIGVTGVAIETKKPIYFNDGLHSPYF